MMQFHRAIRRRRANRRGEDVSFLGAASDVVIGGLRVVSSVSGITSQSVALAPTFPFTAVKRDGVVAQ